MLLSLRQALAHSCSAAITLDVLGSTLQPAAHRITLKYSKLQPAEPWQARLAADVWHAVETCEMMTQPVAAAGRCNCVIALSLLRQCLPGLVIFPGRQQMELASMNPLLTGHH